MLFARRANLISIFALAAASVAAQAAPVTYQFSTSNIGTTVFSPDFTSAKEQGISVSNVASPTLPVAMPNYNATVDFDQSQPVGSTILGGSFSNCSADSNNCVSGSISNFAFQPSVGPFTRVTSVSTIFGGTGVFGGATGGWSNDAYSVATPSGYLLLGFLDGTLTQSGGTTHAAKRGVVVSGVTTDNPAFPFSQATETGLATRGGLSSDLPIAVTDWSSDDTFDGNGVLTGASVKTCSADGLHCVFGQLIDFAVTDLQTIFRSISTIAIVGGTGIYSGATGQWQSEHYGANYIDPTTGLFGSAIVGFSDGEITVNVPEPSTLVVFLLGLLLASRQIFRTRARIRRMF